MEIIKMGFSKLGFSSSSGNRKFQFWILFSGLLFNCNPEKISIQRNDNGVVTRMPYNWKTSISNGPLGSSLYKGFIISGKGVLYAGKRKSPDVNEDTFLGVKDFNSGKDVWIWDGFFNNKLKQVLHDQLSITDNTILINDLDAIYAINAVNGKEHWKAKRIGSVSNITAVGNMFFFSARKQEKENSGRRADMIYSGDLATGEIQPFIELSYSEEFAKLQPENYYIGGTNWLRAFKKDNEVMIIVPYEENGPIGLFTDQRSFFGLYNVTQRKWIYDRAPLSFVEEGSSQSVMPQVVGDKVYLTSLATVGCFDLMTGTKIWQKRVTNVHTGIFDMLVAEDRVVVNVHNAEMHCLNAATGDLYWTQKSSGFSSDMYYQDGVVYWIPSKNLRAVDIQTGQVLWDLPTMDKENGSIWRGFVTGTPAQGGGKGRIYTTSDLYMYSFDAAK